MNCDNAISYLLDIYFNSSWDAHSISVPFSESFSWTTQSAGFAGLRDISTELLVTRQ